MKTVIASSGNNLNDKVDSRFARCNYFCFYDSENQKSEFMKNSFADQQSGVGQKVVGFLAEKGIERVVATEFGPKAKDMMESLTIQMIVVNDRNLTIQEIINKIVN